MRAFQMIPIFLLMTVLSFSFFVEMPNQSLLLSDPIHDKNVKLCGNLKIVVYSVWNLTAAIEGLRQSKKVRPMKGLDPTIRCPIAGGLW
jgi:hypothetical protein